MKNKRIVKLQPCGEDHIHFFISGRKGKFPGMASFKFYFQNGLIELESIGYYLYHDMGIKTQAFLIESVKKYSDIAKDMYEKKDYI
jgi:hypothetical protein